MKNVVCMSSQLADLLRTANTDSKILNLIQQAPISFFGLNGDLPGIEIARKTYYDIDLVQRSRGPIRVDFEDQERCFLWFPLKSSDKGLGVIRYVVEPKLTYNLFLKKL